MDKNGNDNINEKEQKVSVCVPAYNNAAEAERLLQSVYSQKYTDFEVCLSDDSTDNEIEELVKTRYPQVKYIHNKKPFGHILNWNAAIRMAEGGYIKIMFSDDWFTDENSLGRFVAMLDGNPQAMLAFSGSRQVTIGSGGNDTGQYYDRCADTDFTDRLKKDYRLLFLGNQIGAPSATIYRRASALALFDEQSNWASDMYLYFELLRKCPVFAHTEAPLVSIGVHDHQYTESFAQKDERIYQDYRNMYTKYGLGECPACREYFTERFIIKYHKGIREARALGIGSGLYWKKYWKELYDSVRCFMRRS